VKNEGPTAREKTTIPLDLKEFLFSFVIRGPKNCLRLAKTRRTRYFLAFVRKSDRLKHLDKARGKIAMTFSIAEAL
jgi:hypothetical protein